ncbi:MAG: diguanylate cyclase [Acidobacteriota bacterium]
MLASNHKPIEILVVDDDPDICLLVKIFLQKEGFAAITTNSITEALSALTKGMPDGIITDIVLPDGTGYQLVELVRKLLGGERPVILMISSLNGFLDKVEAIRCGADGYFEKPLDWEVLLRRLLYLLERKEVDPSRIIVVSDDESIFYKSLLESAGYQVYLSTDSRNFETDLKTYQPDLVIVEKLQHGLSEADLINFLRQDERYATLPVLVLLEIGNEQVENNLKNINSNGILIKPFPPGILLSMVASRIEQAQLVKNLLVRDGLTRLLTHRAFEERASALLARRRRYPQISSAFVMIDLDHFKSVNDRYGHPVGDIVLISLAKLFQRRLRRSDIIGRYGGEEFAVIIDDLQENDVIRLLSLLLDEFRNIRHKATDGSLFQASFSVGIAMWEPAMTLESWKQAADNALYAAKAAGRNCIRTYQKSHAITS